MLPLSERIPTPGPDLETPAADSLFDAFLGWTSDINLELYPAQEEAILEILSGQNQVILNTPTGSGKSLVALAVHFKAICEGSRSFYTTPIKALASEKFFDLCNVLGAENVGMLTGDASINPKAPVICCTAEILANLALREGRHAAVDYVVMDEFHYYADRGRGMAWQIPLLELRDATFLLMSATLGDMTNISRHLENLSGKPVALIRSRERPVPLDYEYRETPLHETLEDLLQKGKAPIYLVNFTQREATEQAQNILSINFLTKEQKSDIKDAIGHFRFDTPFGKDMRRLAHHGIGLHHAGLLPKYRLLVEQLAQQGHLKVISGTDTLGVGVNIPIRTVLFTKLSKFNGEQIQILSVRDFQQIAGRAGRKGFDERGSVVAQAPEHVIENKRIEAKAAGAAGKKKKNPKKKSPPRGFVHFDATTFQRLIDSDPEPLRSQFRVDNNVLMNVLHRDLTFGRPDGGYKHLIDLIARSHESPAAAHHHRIRAAQFFRSLLQAGIVQRTRIEGDRRRYVRVREDLQRDFSLHHTLSLYLVNTLEQIPQESATYALDVLTLAESVIESPRAILAKQVERLKTELINQLKADGVDYEERMERLDTVTFPKPNEDFLYETFNAFRTDHPWVREDNVKPKSILRDIYERYASFYEYVREYGLQRSEGVLLRYLSQGYKTLIQNVPESNRTEPLVEALAFLRTMLGHVDSSLIKEWESLLEDRASESHEETSPSPIQALLAEPKVFRARLRAEAHRVLKALVDNNFEEAHWSLRTPDEHDPELEPWDPSRLKRAMEEIRSEVGDIFFDARARMADMTHITDSGNRTWTLRQTLLDPNQTGMGYFEAKITLRDDADLDGPLLQLVRLGT